MEVKGNVHDSKTQNGLVDVKVTVVNKDRKVYVHEGKILEQDVTGSSGNFDVIVVSPDDQLLFEKAGYVSQYRDFSGFAPLSVSLKAKSSGNYSFLWGTLFGSLLVGALKKSTKG